MKIKTNIILLCAMLGLLTACRDDVTPPYTVGEADNAISLRAGISEGGEGVAAVPARNGVRRIASGAEDNHTTPGHVNFTSGTKLTLRVDGTWTGHSPVTISKTTTASTGAQTGADNKHNDVVFSTTSAPIEQLYWDDYGTADPANKTTGRAEGLTIYGAAVDGETTAPTISSWTAQPWNVGEPSTGVIDQTGGWAAKDLLTSNNIQVVDAGKPYATDGTYKFDDYLNDLKNSTTTASNLLEFTHAMTKITVNLTAGEGFPGWSTLTPNDGKFNNTPSVVLKGFNYIGKVDIEGKTSTPTQADGTTETTPVATADITMHTVTGGNVHKATLDALVFPGNQFSATIGAAPNYIPTSSTDILELNADGNIYKVTAAQLVKAIAGTSTTGTPVNGTLLQGKNYILNITVNKTKIVVTATIKNWEDVETENALPKINVTATYGYTAGAVTGSEAFTKDYDLFRSTVKATGYDEDANSSNGIQYAARYTSSAWDKTIYWPDHQTHYFFRGVYPQVGTAVSGTTALGAEAVTTVSGNDVIAVANATYTAATYPSELAIAIPRKTDGTLDETCKETGHTATEGICATEGVINMNFEYAMSKVEVRLKSSATDASHIDLTKDNTTVEIIGGYYKARIKLSDGLHDAYADADKGNYKLSNLTMPVTDFLVTTRDAIVPQEIGNDVIFRITVTTGNNGTPADPSDDPTDVYECKVNLINVKNSSPATPVTEWEHGKHYIYELDVNKTAVTMVATIKDWVTVTASDNVWF